MILHPTKGVNPRLGVCTRCGKENGIIMLGDLTTKGVCNNCGTFVYGARGVCPKCHKTAGYRDIEQIGEHERIPNGICDECERELQEYAQIVAAGGIYWRCSSCHANGVIRSNELTAEFRQTNNIPAPKPCGIEFSDKDCPVCGPKEEA